MLQTASALTYQPLAARLQTVPRPATHNEAAPAKQATNDLSVLYPEAVLRSSDAIGWQNVRAIYFRHAAKEAVIPASDDHCIVKNLGNTFFTSVNPGKRRFTVYN